MTETPSTRLARATATLEALRRDLSAEISGYPTPIAGCDAQFNHLLDLRHRVTAALAALHSEVHIPTPRAPDASPR